MSYPDSCGRTAPAILENALEDYAADGTEIIEVDMFRIKVKRTWGTAITLQSAEVIDQLVQQPVACASLWSLTGSIDEVTTHPATHRQYDDFLKETHEMSILQAITKNRIGDLATREYVEKHMSSYKSSFAQYKSSFARLHPRRLLRTGG
ncbi:hypothetical protein HKX48_004678 [Thoreauomyces humboldtii]|nr:hypothetical protein HKX48_004678 [Thoreauomyces humboldtii]